MSGFCGFATNNQVYKNDDIIMNMADKMRHRDKNQNPFIGKIDAKNGLSVFHSDFSHSELELNQIILFDGIIYNRGELIKMLCEVDNKNFTELSDEELVLKGFQQQGEKIVGKLRGAFAFVIITRIKNDREDDHLDVFMARDHFGMCPFHYAKLASGDFIFASEIKSILEHPAYQKEFNDSMLDHYLSFQYAPPAETFFKDIFCLMPAHFGWFKNGQLDLTRYWAPKFQPNNTLSLESAIAKIENAVEESVTAHKTDLNIDKIGCFLSGGVDSSYVASYFKGGKAFTVAFKGYKAKQTSINVVYDESDFAAELAKDLDIEHMKYHLDANEFWDTFSKIQYHLDQPLADPACVPLCFVSRLAAKHFDTVMSGEGADEFFAGYRIYNEPNSLRKYQKIPKFLRKSLAVIVKPLPFFKGKSFIIRGSKSLEERFIGNANIFNQSEKSKMLKNISATDSTQKVSNLYQDTVGENEITRMQYIDLNTWMLGDILLKADRMSRAHGLKIRSPLNDIRLFETASTIPPNMLVTNGTTKYAFRKAAQRHIPESSTKRPKLGFPVPISTWLRDEKYYHIVKDYFSGEIAEKFFNKNYILKLLNDHFSEKADNSRKVWTIFTFIKWYEVYFS